MNFWFWMQHTNLLEPGINIGEANVRPLPVFQASPRVAQSEICPGEASGTTESFKTNTQFSRKESDQAHDGIICTQAETTCPLSYIMIKVFIAQDYLSCLLSVCISSMTRYEDQVLVAVRKSSRAALTRHKTRKQDFFTGGEEDP